MSDPERLTFDMGRALTSLELDENCSNCLQPLRKHSHPDHRCPGDQGGSFEPKGTYAPVPPKLQQERALRKAELTGWRPIWQIVRDKDGKAIGRKLKNEAEMWRVAKEEAKGG